MNYREHEPAHFHAWYSGAEITVDIADGRVHGQMPNRAVTLILEWWKLRRDELMVGWKRAQERRPLEPIEPLE